MLDALDSIARYFGRSSGSDVERERDDLFA